jgi:hypothetical protein
MMQPIMDKAMKNSATKTAGMMPPWLAYRPDDDLPHQPELTAMDSAQARRAARQVSELVIIGRR